MGGVLALALAGRLAVFDEVQLREGTSKCSAVNWSLKYTLKGFRNMPGLLVS